MTAPFHSHPLLAFILLAFLLLCLLLLLLLSFSPSRAEKRREERDEKRGIRAEDRRKTYRKVKIWQDHHHYVNMCHPHLHGMAFNVSYIEYTLKKETNLICLAFPLVNNGGDFSCLFLALFLCFSIFFWTSSSSPILGFLLFILLLFTLHLLFSPALSSSSPSLSCSSSFPPTGRSIAGMPVRCYNPFRALLP